MNSSAEQQIINLSKQKWDWMSAQDVAPLGALFNEQAVFVHMGATFSKEQELDVIKTGRIHYRDVDIRTSRSGSSEAPPSCSPHFSSDPWWMGTKSRTLHRHRGLRSTSRRVDAGIDVLHATRHALARGVVPGRFETQLARDLDTLDRQISPYRHSARTRRWSSECS
jgi:hypothetical protein